MINFSSFPIVTISLIAINIAVFAFGFLTDTHTQIIRNYGFIPDSLFKSNNLGINFNDNPNGNGDLLSSLTRLFTSMFIHASVAHILFNLFVLAYIGRFAERAIGIPRYLAVYFVSGIFAALFHGIIASFILGNGDVLLIGASGAISGVLGMSAAIGNKQAYYWLLLQVVFAFIGSASSIPIAFTAHIGGFIAGLLLTKAFVSIDRNRRATMQY